MLARPPLQYFSKHKWPRARLDMTVCAGFLCYDGIIIGADTEKSGGMKRKVHTSVAYYQQSSRKSQGNP